MSACKSKRLPEHIRKMAFGGVTFAPPSEGSDAAAAFNAIAKDMAMAGKAVASEGGDAGLALGMSTGGMVPDMDAGDLKEFVKALAKHAKSKKKSKK